MKTLSSLTLILLLSSARCGSEAKSERSEYLVQTVERHKDWNSYWYAGEAEITSYDLRQSRYGEIRDGHAVLVFVTEPFSQRKQVKLDRPQEAGDDKVSVLKLNFTKKFNTGIYPYSMMQSVFTPVDLNEFPHSLKTSMTGQEWCGHVFQQLNLEGEKFEVQLYSYFESEGDDQYRVDAELLEDEIWNRIRINPESLPIGTFQMIPGSMAARLMHGEIESEPVTTSLNSLNSEINEYVINYEKSDRTLKIRFKKEFPYEIQSWEESFVNAFNGERQSTTGTLRKRIKSAYWNKNGNKHLYLRDSLNLPR